MKIDENAVVPLSWMFAGFGAIIGVTIVGTFWVSAVNFRLMRIEQKLGIPLLEPHASLVKDAVADEKLEK